MEGVAAPTSEDSLEREAQGGAKRYVSRHRMSPNAWSSPTLRPSAEAESISSAPVLSPHKPRRSGQTKAACVEFEVICCRWSGTLGITIAPPTQRFCDRTSHIAED